MVVPPPPISNKSASAKTGRTAAQAVFGGPEHLPHAGGAFVKDPLKKRVTRPKWRAGCSEQCQFCPAQKNGTKMKKPPANPFWANNQANSRYDIPPQLRCSGRRLMESAMSSDPDRTDPSPSAPTTTDAANTDAAASPLASPTAAAAAQAQQTAAAPAAAPAARAAAPPEAPAAAVPPTGVSANEPGAASSSPASADAAAARDDGPAPAEGAGASTGDASAKAETTAAGGSKKKRRRRRKKKKDGTAESGGDGRPHKRGGKPERPAFNIGDEVFGRVTQLTRHAIVVEVAGGKAHGLYDRDQLIQVPPRPGEQFIAKVKGLSSRGGMLMLGDEPFDITASRTELRAALENKTPLPCFVTGVIRGGIEVDFKGVRAFAPASHVDLRAGADFMPLLGEKMEFTVVHYGKRGRDVVMSRKEVITEEQKKIRDQQLAKLEDGKTYTAIVRTIVNWGVFMTLPELDDIEGFVHMSEASHDRSARLSQVFKIGEEAAVKVVKVDNNGKLWLSHKATIDDPWATAAEKYKRGSYHNCEVVRLTDFGAFLRLEPGIDGLCHVADLAYKPLDHPKDAVSVGQKIDVVIANIDTKARRVTLHPAPPEDERKETHARVKQYQQVQVEVMKIEENGLAVRIIGATGRHARGFIQGRHTGAARGELRKAFSLGQRLTVKVLDVDGRHETRLSISALKKDAEKKAYRDYRKKVKRESSFGTFADLLKGKL